MNKILSTVTILSALLIGSFSQADCPVKTPDLDAIVAAVSATKGCDQASQVAESCAWGSTADIQIAGAAINICNKGFDGRLKKSEVAMNAALNEKCEEKYAGQDGTMYRSFAAFCYLNVSKLFNELYN